MIWNDELEWLLRCVQAAHGLKAGSMEPATSRDMSDTWPAHEALHRRGPDVRRARALLARWERLERLHQETLYIHYRRRPPAQQTGGNSHAWPIGAELLGDVCGVALWEARKADELHPVLDELERRKTGPKSERHKVAAVALVTAAHAAWEALAKAEADAWVA